MKLTNKCLEDFRKYISFHHGLDLNDWEVQKQVFLNALIIEFFDSVGIYISPTHIHLYSGLFFNSMVRYGKQNNEIGNYNTRPEAINKAIEKANEIYNSKEK